MGLDSEQIIKMIQRIVPQFTPDGVVKQVAAAMSKRQ